jgi:hypothetical protein
MSTPAYDRERDLQDQITELAETWLGWRWVHFRPARTKHGWRTPVSGPLGLGWPDLILVRDSRIIAAELKSSTGVVSEAQADVLATLGLAGVEVYLWRPADWDSIVEVLR